MKKDLSFLDDIKIAHRGLCFNGLIENSMSAFKECVRRDIPIELDVHILKDNTLVVIHDDDTKRVAGQKIILKDSVYEDIKNLRLIGNNEKIPLLSEVLNMVNGKVLLDIELKYDVFDFRICCEVCKLLDRYKGKFVVKSFNSIYVWWLKKNRPNYIRGQLISKSKKKIFWGLFSVFSNPDFVAFNYKKLPSKKIDKLYEKGVPILLYTIKSNEKIEYKYTGIIYEC